ncbi:MAG: class II aldolase/adducin family protein [Acidithiobacillus sp.]
MDTQDIAQALLDTAGRLRDRGLLFRGSHANLSARSGERMLMTRGGDVAQLRAEDLDWAGLDGSGQEAFQPTFREVIEMHVKVYAQRRDFGGIVHCHPAHLTAFAIAQQPLPAVYEPLLRLGIHEDVPVVAWAPRGSQESVDGILRAFVNPATSAVLLSNHGVLVAGADLGEALARLTILEEAAELVLHARALGGAKPLPKAAYEEVVERQRRFQATS